LHSFATSDNVSVEFLGETENLGSWEDPNSEDIEEVPKGPFGLHCQRQRYKVDVSLKNVCNLANRILRT